METERFVAQFWYPELGKPFTSLPESYWSCRYACLREPIGAPPGSERIDDDVEALHVWLWDVKDETVVGIVRVHRIPADSIGVGKDHAGPGATVVPGFWPLSDQPALRPAAQMRQMGVSKAYRGHGLGAKLFQAVVRIAVEAYGITSMWMHARVHAVGFYERLGCSVYGEAYDIAGVGPHRMLGMVDLSTFQA